MTFPEERREQLEITPKIQVIGTMGNGAKAIRLEDLPAEAWTVLTGGHAHGELNTLYEAVPWLFRGVNVRSTALSKMPFAIFDGENEIDNSSNYKNVVGWWPNPKKDLWLIEASLSMTGRAYMFKTRTDFMNNLIIQRLRYLTPHTINPKLDKELGLVGFKRTLSPDKIIPVDDIVWFWHPDYQVEIGPPHTSPALAASRAAGVLFNIDNFVAAFFERGAIKASILATPRGTLKDERAKLKSWWERTLSGIKNAFATQIINADDVKVITIGEGIQELSNVELTKEKRQDISTALGVPQNLLFSDDANFATAKQDDFRLIDQTIEPESLLIEGFFNELLFSRLGLSLKFFPEALQISQEEEVRRSAAMVNYERANFPPWVTTQMLGIDLPIGMTNEDLEEQIKEYQMFKASLNPPKTLSPLIQDPSTADPEAGKVLKSYENHALKRLDAGKKIKGTKDAPVFDGNGKVSEVLLASIGGALNNIKSSEDIKRIFANAKQWENYP